MSSKVDFHPVPLVQFAAIFPHAAPWLAAAATIDPSLTLEASVNDVLEGKATLWVIMVDGDIVGAFMTALYTPHEDAANPFVGVYGLGGKRLDAWAKALGERMTAYAKEIECARVRFYGREAWSRVLPAFRIIGVHDNGHALYERAVA